MPVFRSTAVCLVAAGLAGCATNRIARDANGVPALQPVQNANAPTTRVPDAVARFSAQSVGQSNSEASPPKIIPAQAIAQIPKPGDEVKPADAINDPSKPAGDVRYVVARVEFVPLAAPPAPAAGKPAKKAAPKPIQPPPPTDTEPAHKLDFATALALATGQNPQVAFAQARIQEAWANLEAARALWLPSLRAGASVNKHEGGMQEVIGNVFDISRGAVNAGLGTGAVGAGSPPIAGLSTRFHFADAIFQPLIAERTTSARQFEASAVTNDLLLDTALAYLELLRAVGMRKIAVNTLKNTQQLARRTAAFARSGEGLQADADRAQAEVGLRENTVTRADEAIQVASARLAELLRLGGKLNVRPAESALTPIELVALDRSLEELVTVALSGRPELAATSLQAAAEYEGWRREKYAMWIPTVRLDASYGGFGGGSGIENFRDRLDFDAVAFWEVRNLGVGDRTARTAALSRMHQAQFRELRIRDQVTREVSEAFAAVHSAKRQMETAGKSAEAAGDSYDRNVARIKERQGLPIEVLQSIQALDEAQRERLRTLVDYNAAQFRLHRALGWPIAPPTPKAPAAAE